MRTTMRTRGTLAVVGTVALGTFALGTAALLAARRTLRRLQANPDAQDLDTLRRDPDGDTVIIDRPDGTRIRAVVAGDGPTVLLAHGYSVSLREWNLVMDQLVARGHRAIAFDWRGHGQSTMGSDGVAPEAIAGDYVAILEHFDVHDAVLVGHSTGGYLAIATLLAHPEVAPRLTGLVLLASLAGDALQHAPQNRLQLPLIRSGIMQRIVRTELLGLPFAASIYGPDPSPAACQVFLEEFRAHDHRATLPLLARLADTGFYDRLGELTVPTVVICGEQDRTTPRWHSEAMGRDIPDARTVWVPDAGHMLNWQRPDVLVDVITDLTAPTRA